MNILHKYGFLFGAGAEVGYGLPNGGTYTYQTILQKRSKMYNELKKFYEKRLTENYVSEYVKQFLFTENSHTYCEIIYDSLNSISSDTNLTKSELKLVESILKIKNDEQQIIKKAIKSTYKVIVTDESECATDLYPNLIKNLTYYGAIEKDFACIVNPNKVGKIRFWRLINYMWSAYFSIIIPLLDNSEKYKNKEEYNKDKYSFVLENLKDITDYIYSNEFFQSFHKNDSSNNDYYIAINESLKPYCFITTNYTPFAKQCLNADRILNTAYLAGELSVFELPTELTVKNLKCEDIEKTDFVFPFMMTQAMVKPIINKYQLTEYSKAISYLNEIDTLIILGYSLCENDNHIVSLLRDYIMNPNKRLIYFEYECDGVKKVNFCKENLRDKLKIEEDVLNRVELIIHNGNAKDVVNKIKERL